MLENFPEVLYYLLKILEPRVGSFRNFQIIICIIYSPA